LVFGVLGEEEADSKLTPLYLNITTSVSNSKHEKTAPLTPYRNYIKVPKHMIG